MATFRRSDGDVIRVRTADDSFETDAIAELRVEENPPTSVAARGSVVPSEPIVRFRQLFEDAETFHVELTTATGRNRYYRGCKSPNGDEKSLEWMADRIETGNEQAD